MSTIQPRPRVRAVRMTTAVLAVLVALLAIGGSFAGAKPKKPKPKPQAPLSLTDLSSRPDLVTGGDSLVAVDVPSGIATAKVRVRRNGVDVTSAFTPAAGNARRLVGLVTDLRNGDNRISARVDATNAARPAELNLFNSAIQGPLFSGPRQAPYICTTSSNQNALGTASTDGSCSVPTATTFRYRSTTGTFKPLANPAVRPTDVAQTTTRTGETVDYIVRIESGVIDRSIYRWTILDPGGVVGKGWNGRFFYTFGGGCTTGYQQGVMPVGAVLPDRELSQGYVVISSSLNRFATACNDVLSAEATSMVKEHVIESLRQAPVWTIGQGGSGGSVQIQMAAQNYPGLLNGILPSMSFPDNSLSNSPDCRLLQNYFTSPAGASLTDAQRIAISGLEDPDGCVALSQQADVINAGEGCEPGTVPASIIFDPATNPTGIRCSIFDSMINVYGTNPATGLARRTDDNVGIQYGLQAVQNGTITPAEFIGLNKSIGGFDQNGDIVAARSVADPTGLEIAYKTGRINQGSGGYPDVPVIDTRDYTDTGINVHQFIYSYEMRARLDRTNGAHANQVMFQADSPMNVQPMQATALDLMGTWLDAISADTSDRPLSQKVVAAKPATAVDACWIGGNRVDDPAVIGSGGPCETALPPHSLPRLEAGQPLGAPTLKCRLRPIAAADYPSFTNNQLIQVSNAFPNGVCDYSRDGVSQQVTTGPWQEFGPPRSIPQRKRSLKLVSKTRRRGHTTVVDLTASLKPCPSSTWQLITFQRVKKGKWANNGVRIAGAKGCSAKISVAIRKATKFRAISKFTSGYAGAHSKPQKKRPVKVRHHP